MQALWEVARLSARLRHVPDLCGVTGKVAEIGGAYRAPSHMLPVPPGSPLDAISPSTGANNDGWGLFSGTSARLALLHDEGGLATGEPLRHLSIVGSEFTGRVVEETPAGVVTEVEGSAHLTGRHEFVLDPADELGEGFLLR